MQTMPLILNTVLVLYSSVLIINCIAYLFLWKKEKDQLYKFGFALWAFTFVNFFLQGVFSQLNLYAVLSFSTYYIAAITLCNILGHISEVEFNFKKFHIGFGIGLTLSLLLSVVNASFTIVALPVAIAIAAPMVFYSSYLLFKVKKVHTDIKVLSAVTLLQALHFLDYPFLRPIQTMALFGFSLALGITFLFSILLPSAIIRFRLNIHNQKLENEIVKRKDVEASLVLALEETKVASKVKDQFLANVSHEMRTPLNIILGMNSLLLDSNLNDEQQGLVTSVNENGEKLLNIVTDILNFTSLSQKNSFKVNINISFDIFNKKIRDLIANLNAEKNIDVNIDLVHSKNILTADVEKILQTIRCLVDNAIKFSNDKPINIQTRIIRKERGIAFFRFTVEDQGPGIAQEDLDKVFEKFNQIDNSATRNFGGVGLGLTLSKKMLEFLDGRIDVNSTVGKGSTFSFELPVNFVVDIEKEEKKYLSDLDTDDVSNLKGKKVLIVEDDVASQFVIKKILENFGPEIYIASDGKKAFELREKIDFDTVIMDIQMPVMNGLESIQKIRKFERDGRKRPTNIIAISNKAFESDKLNAIEAGANEFLQKPLVTGDLLKVVVGDLQQIENIV